MNEWQVAKYDLPVRIEKLDSPIIHEGQTVAIAARVTREVFIDALGTEYPASKTIEPMYGMNKAAILAEIAAAKVANQAQTDDVVAALEEERLVVETF